MTELYKVESSENKEWKNKLKTDTIGYIACQDEEFVLNLESEQQVKIVLNRKMM